MRILRPRAYTLIEVLVATAVTLVIALIVFCIYISVNEGFRRTEQELRTLSALRGATAALERHLQHAVAKSGYVPASPPRFKGLHDGFLRLQWPGAVNHLEGYPGGLYQDGKCRYLGFYSSSDGNRTDRIEYYFNPPEPKTKCANGADDDGDDDPDDRRNPLHLMRDDRGRLMLRVTPDSRIAYDQYHNWPPQGADSISTAAFPAYQAPRLTGQSGSGYDCGETVAEGFTDVYFEFLYTRPRAGAAGGELDFACASRWPFTRDLNDASKDDTGELWPRNNSDGKQPRGVSFIALPLAVRVTFECEAGGTTRRFSQTILLPQSQWHEFTTRSER